MTFDIIVHVMAVFVRGSRSVYAGGITAIPFCGKKVGNLLNIGRK